MSRNTSETPKERIQRIRHGIDFIDKQVLELISDRIGLAMELRDLKGVGQPIWAPDREHLLLRRLLAEKPANLSDDLVARIWSTLISASLQAQGSLQILYAHDGLALMAETAFPGAPARKLESDWIADMAATPHAVGVLPPPDSDHVWWMQLARSDAGVYIQTALPKLRATKWQAVCVACQPAPMRDDQLCLFAGTGAPPEAARVLAQSGACRLWQIEGALAREIVAVPCLRDGDEMPTHVGSFFPPLT